MASKLPTFPNGAKWVRADFHLHTRADKEFTYQGSADDFRRNYIAALKEADISLGVITNHNKFDAEEFRSLRSTARSQGIELLPGVELSIGDGDNGIHTLVIFSDDWVGKTEDFINPFLTHAFAGKQPSEYEHENGRTSGNILDTLEKLRTFQKDYFLVFAHVEAGSGLWKEMSGGRLTELVKKECFQRQVLGFQKVRTHDGGGKRVPCRTKVQDWLAPWYPAEVEGSDPKAIDQIGKGKQTYLKLGELSFESVQFALRDYAQRVAKAPVDSPRTPRLKKVTFTGGKLGTQAHPTYEFSEQLTCLIGSRGSGKSSVLECLRYGLGLDASEADSQYKVGLISHMLANGGEITIDGSLGDGREFRITRALRMAPQVFVDGVQVNLSPSKLLDGLLYFGQKDLGNRQEGFEDNLFEKLIGRRTIEEAAEEERLVREIESLTRSWREVKNANEKVQDYREEAEQLKLKLDVFKKKGVEKQLKEQTVFVRDKREVKEFLRVLREFQSDLRSDDEEWDDVHSRWPALESEGLAEMGTSLAELRPRFSKIRGDYQELLKELDELIISAEEELHKIEAKEKLLQEKFLAVQREIDAPGLNLSEFRTLTDRHEKLLKLIKAADNQKTSSGEAAKKLRETGRRLHDLRRKWHREEAAAVQKANTHLPDSLRLELTFEAKTAAFEDFLKRLATGKGVRKTSYTKIIERFSNGLALVEGAAELEKLLGGSADVAKVKEILSENLAEVLSFQTPDQRRVLFNGTSIDDLSLGQRATALLQLLMSLESHPIFLIDQPEDDLDNETIFREVVGPLLERKKHSQFIIATHNPNIPVLGDAELVHACRETEHQSYHHRSGSLDTKAIREEIITIMEGGEAAFDKRQQIYNQWTNSPSAKSS